jgi:hypothetical protein
MNNEDGNDLRVLVVLEADTIVVTMPDSNYSISYWKLHDTPGLVSSEIRDDPDSPISKLNSEHERGLLPMRRRESLGGLCDPKESPGEVSGPRLSRSSAQMATDTGRLQL